MLGLRHEPRIEHASIVVLYLPVLDSTCVVRDQPAVAKGSRLLPRGWDRAAVSLPIV